MESAVTLSYDSQDGTKQGGPGLPQRVKLSGGVELLFILFVRTPPAPPQPLLPPAPPQHPSPVPPVSAQLSTATCQYAQ